jgi:hypothetical protein
VNKYKYLSEEEGVYGKYTTDLENIPQIWKIYHRFAWMTFSLSSEV